jgi:hypothetical protein
MTLSSVSLADYIAMVSNHDWHYDWSDDPRVYDRGKAQWDELKRLAKENPEFKNVLQEEYRKRFKAPLVI